MKKILAVLEILSIIDYFKEKGDPKDEYIIIEGEACLKKSISDTLEALDAEDYAMSDMDATTTPMPELPFDLSESEIQIEDKDQPPFDPDPPKNNEDAPTSVEIETTVRDESTETRKQSCKTKVGNQEHNEQHVADNKVSEVTSKTTTEKCQKGQEPSEVDSENTQNESKSVIETNGLSLKDYNDLYTMEKVNKKPFEQAGLRSGGAPSFLSLGKEKCLNILNSFTHQKEEEDEEIFAVNTLSKMVKGQFKNAKVIASVTKSTEDDVKSLATQYANLFFRDRGYDKSGIDAWFQNIMDDALDYYQTLKQGKKVEVVIESKTKVADTSVTPIQYVDATETKTTVSVTPKCKDKNYEKMLALGLEDEKLQQFFDGFTAQEKLDLFLDSTADTETEEAILNVVADRIRKFFGEKHNQKETDQFRSLLNIFFDQRPYDRKIRNAWVENIKNNINMTNLSFLYNEVKPVEQPKEDVDFYSIPPIPQNASKAERVAKAAEVIKQKAAIADNITKLYTITAKLYNQYKIENEVAKRRYTLEEIKSIADDIIRELPKKEPQQKESTVPEKTLDQVYSLAQLLYKENKINELHTFLAEELPTVPECKTWDANQVKAWTEQNFPTQPKEETKAPVENKSDSNYNESYIKAIHWATNKRSLKTTVCDIIKLSGNTKETQSMIIDIIRDGKNTYLKQLSAMPTAQLHAMLDAWCS